MAAPAEGANSHKRSGPGTAISIIANWRAVAPTTHRRGKQSKLRKLSGNRTEGVA